MFWQYFDATGRVLLATALLGCASGMIGSFALLRRRALVGDMVAHAALPGICIGYFIATWWQIDRASVPYFTVMLLAAAATGVLGIQFATFVCRWTRTKEDAAIGIVLSTFYGGGIVLLSLIKHLPGAGKAGLSHVLYGQAAAIQQTDLIIISIAFVIVSLVIALLYKEFKVLSFDADFARSQGWPTALLDAAMMSTLCLITVIGLPAVGAILMAGLLIIPCAAARFWTNRLGILLLLACLFGAAMGLGGTGISAGFVKEWLGYDPLRFGLNNKNLPTGPLIILTGTAIFVVSLLLAPRRGVIARVAGQLLLRYRTARENLLRTLYELTEPFLPDRRSLSVERLRQVRATTKIALGWLLWRFRTLDWIVQDADGIRLTETGLRRAAEQARTHRLWELYLIRRANIAPDHVDRDADLIEHVLPRSALQQLETELAEAGRLPEVTEHVPKSPHDMDGSAGRKTNPENSTSGIGMTR